MNNASEAKRPGSPERLFPFVLRARKLLIGREVLARSRSNLQFILISTDISDNSKKEILRSFASYPVLQKYSSAELENFFSVRNAKVVGFAKSTLAKSLYSELKDHRINKPPLSRPNNAQRPDPKI